MKYDIELIYNVTQTVSVDLPDNAKIKDIFVKWEDIEIELDNAEDVELELNPKHIDELHDFKRPDHIRVFNKNNYLVYRSK